MDETLSERLKQAREELGLFKAQCRKLQERLDCDDDPDKQELVRVKYEKLVEEHRRLIEEYWMLKADADNFHAQANEIMGELLKTKSANQAWNLLAQYRSEFDVGEELMRTRQADIDQAAYRMRIEERHKILDKKKRRFTVEEGIDKRIRCLTVAGQRDTETFN